VIPFNVPTTQARRFLILFEDTLSPTIASLAWIIHEG
jgi:hypothetical protein